MGCKMGGSVKAAVLSELTMLCHLRHSVASFCQRMFVKKKKKEQEIN